MDAVPEIDVEDAAARLAAGDATFVDIRDPGSFRAAHVPGARHLGDANLQAFLQETDDTTTVIVYCYHGNSSLGGAAYLREAGFADVYSMRGGFEAWRGKHPHESA